MNKKKILLQYPLQSEVDRANQCYQKIWMNSHYPLLASSEFELYEVEAK
jgi:hypothetical protein